MSRSSPPPGKAVRFPTSADEDRARPQAASQSLPPMPPEGEVERLFARYLSLLGTVPDAKRKAYAQLPTAQKWRLVCAAKAVQRETTAELSAAEAIDTLMQPLKANVAFLRRLRVAFDSASKRATRDGDESFMRTFLQRKGHIYLIAVWKAEIATVRQTRVRTSDVLAECCRCARILLNDATGFRLLMHETNVLQYLVFSVHFINIRTQSLVLIAITALALVHPEAHAWLVRYVLDKARVAPFKAWLKSKDAPLVYSTLLLLNALINQCARPEQRRHLRDFLAKALNLRKQMKKLRAKDFMGDADLQTQVLVFEESTALDIRGDFETPVFASPPAEPIGGGGGAASPRTATSLHAPPQRADASAITRDDHADRENANVAELKRLKAALEASERKLKSLQGENETLRAAIKQNSRADPVRVGGHKSVKLSESEVASVAGGLIEIEADEAGNALSEPTALATGKTFDPTATIPEFNMQTLIDGSAALAGHKAKDSKIVSAQAPPPPPPGTAPESGRNLPPPPPMNTGPPPKKKQHPNKKLRPLLWTKIPNAGISATVWEGLDDESVVQELALQEIEDLFCIESATTAPATPLVEKKTLVHLLPSKRGNEIQILLKGSKVPPEEVVTALTSLDVSAWTSDQLASVAASLPSEEEVTLLKAYTGELDDLAPAEAYLYPLIDLPLLRESMRALVFRAHFHGRCSDALSEVKRMVTAIEHIRASPKLPQLLTLILALGNYVNGPSTRGGAYGFRLCSLIKLRDVRAQGDANNTLLHYLAHELTERRPELLNVVKELSSVHDAAKLQLSETKSAIAVLAEEAKHVESLLANDKASEKIVQVFTPFLEGAKERLAELQGALKDMEKLYAEQLKRFGEPAVTASGVFFEYFSDFLVALQGAVEDNENRERERLEAERRALEGPKERRGTRKGPQLPAITQGTLDAAIANLKTANAFHRQATSIARRKTLITEDEQPSWMRELAMRKKGVQIEPASEAPGMKPATASTSSAGESPSSLERKSTTTAARKRDSFIGMRRGAEPELTKTVQPATAASRESDKVLEDKGKTSDATDPLDEALFTHTPAYRSALDDEVERLLAMPEMASLTTEAEAKGEICFECLELYDSRLPQCPRCNGDDAAAPDLPPPPPPDEDVQVFEEASWGDKLDFGLDTTEPVDDLEIDF